MGRSTLLPHVVFLLTSSALTRFAPSPLTKARKPSQRRSFKAPSIALFAICAVALTLASSASAGDTVLYNFNEFAAQPYSTPVSDEYGNLYGTTLYGGDYGCNADTGCGTVFVLCAPNVAIGADVYPCVTGNPSWEEHLLWSFAGGNDGAYPIASVFFLATHNRAPFTLYGTTYYGGKSRCNDGNQLGCGTVFELCAPRNNGGCGGVKKWTERIVHSFTGGRTDGSYPYAAVITDGSGSLFGTTVYGGGRGNCAIENSNNYCGTVFKLKGGAPWTFPETIFHRFTGAIPNCTPYLPGGCDGSNPYGALCCSPSEKAHGVPYFYGTTFTGGDPNVQVGTVFSVKNQFPYVEEELYNFADSPDGANPTAGVIVYPRFNGCSKTLVTCLVGTTSAAGRYNGGMVFLLNMAGPPWTENVLYPFRAGFDGAIPVAGVTLDAPNGYLFGTTLEGGNAGMGMVFELMPRLHGYWPEIRLYSFSGGSADGANPYSGVIFDPPIAQHTLYGTTTAGGMDSVGVVYSVP